ncbi:hypothetical protein D3C86_1880540 [compost metagenome]
MNRQASKMPMAASVLAALFGAGSLKLGMAFEMASTPVKAELPDAKARRRRNSEMPATGVPTGVCSPSGTCPVAIWNKPTPIMMNKARTNR